MEAIRKVTLITHKGKELIQYVINIHTSRSIYIHILNESISFSCMGKNISNLSIACVKKNEIRVNSPDRHVFGLREEATATLEKPR